MTNVTSIGGAGSGNGSGAEAGHCVGRYIASGSEPAEQVACFEWQRGIKVAMRMLEDAGDATLDETGVGAEFREGRPQFNFLLRAIEELQASGSRIALQGFCCVMNDFLGYFAESSHDPLNATRRKVPRPIPMTTEMPQIPRESADQDEGDGHE